MKRFYIEYNNVELIFAQQIAKVRQLYTNVGRCLGVVTITELEGRR